MHDFLYLNAGFGTCLADSPSVLLHPISRDVSRARKHLAGTGWSYRCAAAELGCSFTQLAHVLTGRRRSQSLLSRIQQLPLRKP